MVAKTSHSVVLRSNKLTIRTATESFAIRQLRAVLDEQYYLKASRPAGHVFWQGAYEHDLKSGIDRLVAENFHDPARHQGTLYKITNWTALGLTKGFLAILS